MMAAALQPAPAAVQGPVLRDIHLPPAPAWWPPAPGWWLLGGLLLLAWLAAAWLWQRHRRTLRQRGLVLAELDRLVQQYRHDDDDPAALASGLHQLLRRVARRHDAAAAQQRGEAWRQTLARVPVDATTLERLLALDQAIYRAPASFDPAAASSAVRQWLHLALQPRKWKPLTQESADA